MKFAVCVVLSALAVYAIASDASESESESGLALAPAGTIVSVTALERQDMMNFMIRFNSSDASNPSAQENFPYYEDITASAIDLVRGRYLLLDESLQILYYNLTTLQQTHVMQLPVQQLPDAMHYDAANDLVWLVSVSDTSGFTICSVDANGVQQTCVADNSGSYSYTADASAFDSSAGQLYVQLQSMSSGQPLFVLDTKSGVLSQPMAQVDLCQSMNLALLGNAYTMVCVDFVTNIVVKVDPHTGAWTKLLDLPNAPQPYTATVYNDQSAGTSTLFAELSGIFQNKWVAYDLNTGKQLALSAVTQNWQLAMTQFVPDGKF